MRRGDGDLPDRLLVCRKRLESIRRLRYHSVDDAALLARRLCKDVTEMIPDAALDPVIRARLSAVTKDEGVLDERSLDKVVRELRAVLSRLERDQTDEVGLGVWLRRQSRGRQLTIGVAVAAVLISVVAAITLRERGLARSIAHHDELNAQANALSSAGNYKEATEIYRAALAELPDHKKSAGSYNNLGWALQKQGKVDEAIESYTRALQLDPAMDLARNNLAAAKRAKGQ